MHKISEILDKIQQYNTLIKGMETQIKLIQNDCKHDFQFQFIIYDPCNTLRQYKCIHCNQKLVK
jgi:hypothetical protein